MVIPENLYNMLDKTKIDLNAPAFGEKAQKLEDVIETPKEPVVETVVETPVEVKKEEVVEEPSVEESKVPYSRFKKFHDEAKRFHEEAEMWKAKAEAIEPVRTASEEVKPDDIWLKLYGDTPESREAYKLQQQREEALEQRFRDKALEAVRNEKYEEVQRTEKNLETLDDHLEQVSAVAGRDLTAKEESKILDIIDEYTPKGEGGTYAGAMLSPDKAWRIYELETQAALAPKRQSRDQVASLSNAQPQGESQAVKDERNKNFVPGNWSSWRDRL